MFVEPTFLWGQLVLFYMKIYIGIYIGNTNLSYICTYFTLAGRIKITLARALWEGCCPLTLGVSQKQLLHGGTPPSTAGRFCSVYSHCFLCPPRAKGTWESWLLYSFQLFHHAEEIIKILRKKNMGRKVTWTAESSYIYLRNFHFFFKWLLNIPIHRRHWIIIYRRLGEGEN